MTPMTHVLAEIDAYYRRGVPLTSSLVLVVLMVHSSLGSKSYVHILETVGGERRASNGEPLLAAAAAVVVQQLV